MEEGKGMLRPPQQGRLQTYQTPPCWFLAPLAIFSPPICRKTHEVQFCGTHRFLTRFPCGQWRCWLRVCSYWRLVLWEPTRAPPVLLVRRRQRWVRCWRDCRPCGVLHLFFGSALACTPPLGEREWPERPSFVFGREFAKVTKPTAAARSVK